MGIINRRAPAGPKLNGRYANFLKVGHNAFEFVFDFGQAQGESEEVSISTRIVTAPGYAKTFMETLMESIAQYESEFGIIRHDHGNVES
jgi:hypothetical protein